ncbi:PilZ domain-containing protein [bacterium]|nr:PilZ domain-containing protein [bacterium]
MDQKQDNASEQFGFNDITRLITDEDADLLMNFSSSQETKWEILIGSPDDALCKLVAELFENDHRINITIAQTGCDTLVDCSRILPHLAIIDEKFPDIPSSEVIKCIKRRDELKDTRILYAMESEKSAPPPEGEIDDYFYKSNKDNTYMTRKLNTLLFSSNQIPALKRRWPRLDVDIAAQIQVYSTSDPIHCINGSAQVKNISSTGAFLANINLDEKLNPEDTYRVLLKIDQPPLSNWVAESIMLHVRPDNTAGLKFINLSKQNRLKMANMFEQ